MRLGTYNIEWFNALFDGSGKLWNDDEWSARFNVTRAAQSQAIADVVTHLGCDGLLIVEAPDHRDIQSTAVALERFADIYGLRTNKALIGFSNDTQQEIAFLYDPLVLSVRHVPHSSDAAPRFDQEFETDLDIDGQGDPVVFSKPPLEIEVTHVSGRVVHIIGVHMKSKAPHGAKSREEVIRISIANRRKQLAQAVWVRRRISEMIAQGKSVIVLGDLNDGPGLDEYEHLFGRSSIEIVMGKELDPEAHLFDPHAERALRAPLLDQVSSARFYQKHEKRYLEALLDYIFVTHDLRKFAHNWTIWHPFDHPACWSDRDLQNALLTASDHFPVTLDLRFE